MVRPRQKISTFHKWVLTIGTPFVVIPPFIYLWFAEQAHVGPRRRGKNEIFWWTLTGDHVADPVALESARFWLALWIAGIVFTVGGAIWGASRLERASNRSAIETKWVIKDAPFWSLGDRAGWHDDAGRVITGTVFEVHRRPFTFGDELIDAVAGIPGLVMKSDSDGALVGRPLASVYRLTGSSGPSGTMDSIREAMNEAVQPGDGFSWLNKQGEPVEGVVVSTHDSPFEVAGRRIDASPRRPGYTVRRDGALIGITNELREG